MAVGLSFFLVYTKKKIKENKIEDTPVSIRCQLRFTLSELPWSAANRLGQIVYRVQFIIPAKACPRHWVSGRVKHNSPDAARINATIDDISSRARTLHSNYVKSGAFPSDENFVLEILGHTEAKRSSTFFDQYAEYIDYLRNRRVTAQFISRQTLVRSILIDFERTAGYRVDYTTLGKTFAAKFSTWVAKRRKAYQGSQDMSKTTLRYLQSLKIFLNHALSEGWTTETVWKQIRVEFKPNPFPTTVTEQEIQALWRLTDADIPAQPAIRRNCLITRDWFLFATQSGIRWSDWDMNRFSLINLMPVGMNIRFIQEKTDNPLEVPLSGLAIEILKKNSGNMPQAFSPSATEKHLRILAAAAGITKHITTHTARRTFCTLQEKAGVPRSVIMRISGHRTEKDYLRYIGVSFEYNADMMRRANPGWFDLEAG